MINLLPLLEVEARFLGHSAGNVVATYVDCVFPVSLKRQRRKQQGKHRAVE